MNKAGMIAFCATMISASAFAQEQNLSIQPPLSPEQVEQIRKNVQDLSTLFGI